MPTPNSKTRTTRSNSQTNNSLDDIKQLIETSITNTLRKELDNSAKIIEALLDRVENLERSNELLEQKFSRLHENCNVQSDMMMQNIMKEIQDMEFRKKNIIVFGLQEEKEKSAEERKAYDKNCCEQIFNEINVKGAEIVCT